MSIPHDQVALELTTAMGVPLSPAAARLALRITRQMHNDGQLDHEEYGYDSEEWDQLLAYMPALGRRCWALMAERFCQRCPEDILAQAVDELSAASSTRLCPPRVSDLTVPV